VRRSKGGDKAREGVIREESNTGARTRWRGQGRGEQSKRKQYRREQDRRESKADKRQGWEGGKVEERTIQRRQGGSKAEKRQCEGRRAEQRKEQCRKREQGGRGNKVRGEIMQRGEQGGESREKRRNRAEREIERKRGVIISILLKYLIFFCIFCIFEK
jgi:hypothetical protein